MIDYMAHFPETNEMKKYTTGCTGTTEEKAKANALVYYNVARHNINLPPLDKIPSEVTFTPLNSLLTNA